MENWFTSGSLDAFYPTTNPRQFLQSVRKIKRLDIIKVLPAHHQLNISVNIIDKIESAFSGLERNGQLKQGNGIYDFEDFQIHI